MLHVVLGSACVCISMYLCIYTDTYIQYTIYILKERVRELRSFGRNNHGPLASRAPLGWSALGVSFRCPWFSPHSSHSSSYLAIKSVKTELSAHRESGYVSTGEIDGEEAKVIFNMSQLKRRPFKNIYQFINKFFKNLLVNSLSARTFGQTLFWVFLWG